MNLFSFAADIDICNGLAPVWTIFGYIIIGIQIVVPLLLIISGMITMAQAVMGKKDDDIKKAQKAAAMRFLHSCGFIYTLVCAHISGVTGTAP